MSRRFESRNILGHAIRLLVQLAGFGLRHAGLVEDVDTLPGGGKVEVEANWCFFWGGGSPLLFFQCHSFGVDVVLLQTSGLRIPGSS